MKRMLILSLRILADPAKYDSYGGSVLRGENSSYITKFGRLQFEGIIY